MAGLSQQNVFFSFFDLLSQLVRSSVHVWLHGMLIMLTLNVHGTTSPCLNVLDYELRGGGRGGLASKRCVCNDEVFLF